MKKSVCAHLSRNPWYQKKIVTQTKLHILSSVIIPTLLYGTECAVCIVAPTYPSVAKFHHALFENHPGYLCVGYEA